MQGIGQLSLFSVSFLICRGSTHSMGLAPTHNTWDAREGLARQGGRKGHPYIKSRMQENNRMSVPDRKGKEKRQPAWVAALKNIISWNYSASATTSFTSGIIRFIIPSMPLFSVIIDEGQPEHEPCSMSVTVPLSKPLKLMAPPSISTAGFT